MLWRLITAVRYTWCFLRHPTSTRTRWGSFCPACGVRWDLYW